MLVKWVSTFASVTALSYGFFKIVTLCYLERC